MKIEKKEGIKNIRIIHNKKLFVVIIFLLIVLGILIFFIVKGIGKSATDIVGKECISDSECAPVCGCHPDSCIPLNKKQDCERLICTQECSGPLDCNAGYCGCVNNKCSVVAIE